MVKKLVSVLCICAYFGLAHAQIPQEIWKESEQIEKQIKKTSFPDRVYNIKDFGAKEGNNGKVTSIKVSKGESILEGTDLIIIE